MRKLILLCLTLIPFLISPLLAHAQTDPLESLEISFDFDGVDLELYVTEDFKFPITITNTGDTPFNPSDYVGENKLYYRLNFEYVPPTKDGTDTAPPPSLVNSSVFELKMPDAPLSKDTNNSYTFETNPVELGQGTYNQITVTIGTLTDLTDGTATLKGTHNFSADEPLTVKGFKRK